MKRLWPVSLKGQLLLAIAIALLLAQTISAFLVYRAEHERRESMLLHAAAARIIAATRREAADGGRGPQSPLVQSDDIARPGDRFRFDHMASSPQLNSDKRMASDESELRGFLADQDIHVDDLVVVRRLVARDPLSQMRLKRRAAFQSGPTPDEVMIAGYHVAGASDWTIVRVFIPPNERIILQTLLVQTLFIYAVLVGAIAFILRRITRPLAALTGRYETFAESRDPKGQIKPEGPDDVRQLITAHNAMEARIVALLDEKDVMLGAIGHDLKTPLAALRVRIESVEDETERRRMATTIEDITRTLDDILSLARVGRPSDPAEPTELSALVAAVVDEYEDMGEPVELVASERVVMQVRPTWMRRALRNLVGNALRYGKSASVTLARDGSEAVVTIVDQGPGIAPDQISRMLEPFTRGDPSRNSETGGAGLGLTLARAIAEQHGGKLILRNLQNDAGEVSGLSAVLRLPLG